MAKAVKKEGKNARLCTSVPYVISIDLKQHV